MRIPKDYSTLYYFTHIISIQFSRAMLWKKFIRRWAFIEATWTVKVRLLRFTTGNFCGLHFENSSSKPLLQHTLWAASFAVQTNTAIIQKSSSGLFNWHIYVCIHTTSMNMYDYINMSIYHWYTPLSDFIPLKYFPGCAWLSLSCCADVYVW